MTGPGAAARGRSCLGRFGAVVLTLVVASIVGIVTNAWGFLAVIAVALIAAYVAAADERRARRERAALEDRIGDVSALGRRWAATFARAWRARDGLQECVEALQEGPRRDRLREALRDMDECLVEAGRTARLGSLLEARARQIAPRRVQRQAKRADRAGARPEDLASLERQVEEGQRIARNVEQIRWSLEVHVNEMEGIAADAAMAGLGAQGLTELVERSRQAREGLAALSLAAADLEGPADLELRPPPPDVLPPPVVPPPTTDTDQDPGQQGQAGV